MLDVIGKLQKYDKIAIDIHSRIKYYMNMSKKEVKELQAGDSFYDSLGTVLTVKKVIPLEWSGIPGTQPNVKILFTTPSGNEMFMNMRANRLVILRGVKW